MVNGVEVYSNLHFIKGLQESLLNGTEQKVQLKNHSKEKKDMLFDHSVLNNIYQNPTMAEIENYLGIAKLANSHSRNPQLKQQTAKMGSFQNQTYISSLKKQILLIKNPDTGNQEAYILSPTGLLRIDMSQLERLKEKGYKVEEFNLRTGESLTIKDLNTSREITFTATSTGNIVEESGNLKKKEEKLIHRIVQNTKQHIVNLAKRQLAQKGMKAQETGEKISESNEDVLSKLTKNYSIADHSPEATASRIFKFVTGLFEAYKRGRGNHPETLDRFYNIVTEAVEKGFNEAKAILGALPKDVKEKIEKTHELIFEGLKQWYEKMKKEMM